MRRITDKENENKKNRNKQIWVGIILIGIMLFGTIGYAFQSMEKTSDITKITYNGYEFVKQGDYWTITINSNNFVFKYNPNEVEKINSNIRNIDYYYNRPLYISSKNTEAEYEIYRNMNYFAERVQRACLEGEECEENLPVKNCDNNIIIVKNSDYSDIVQNNSCVFLYSPMENSTAVVDEFLFKALNIEQ